MPEVRDVTKNAPQNHVQSGTLTVLHDGAGCQLGVSLAASATQHVRLISESVRLAGPAAVRTHEAVREACCGEVNATSLFVREHALEIRKRLR